jgi:hypothetical protein
VTSDRRHPTDHERAEAARPAVIALVQALAHRDPTALAALLRDDAVWLTGDGTVAGDEAIRRARAYFADDRGRVWADPQQHGAHAVLRWAEIDAGHVGALVVEMRGGPVVLICEVP